MRNVRAVGDFSMEIVDYTVNYFGSKYIKYIQNAIRFVPVDDLNNIGKINIYDSCGADFPVIAQGGHHPASLKEKGAIDIYLDQNFGHLLTFRLKKSALIKISDSLFIRTFGKLHLVHTFFHEIGHQVYKDQNCNDTEEIADAEEKYANSYANKLYGEMYPLLQKWYKPLNAIYHFFYSNRIVHDNKLRDSKML